MANTLLTPDVLARAALANLYERLVMVPLVYTDITTDLTRSRVGDTVNIRKPATFTANTFDRSSGITIQNATETSVPVVLDTIKDVSFAITSEDLTLHLMDFTEQLLAPAMEALAQSVDQALIARGRADFTQVAGTQTGFELSKPEVLIEAGRQLDIRKVPSSQRAAVVGPTTKAQWLNSELLKRVDQSGSTLALREGSIGSGLLGFDAYWTQNVVQPASSPASGQPTTEVGLAFHKTALALASAPLAKPSSNAWSAVETYKGLSLRIVKEYDINKKQDIVSVDILFGTKTLDANRGVLLRGALAS